LLSLEAADAVRAAARKRGFDEREVFVSGRGFDWSELLNAGANLSLFGGKKIIELRIPTGKPGVEGGDAIARYCAKPSTDNLLLVTMPRPEGPFWKAAWFSALSSAGRDRRSAEHRQGAAAGLDPRAPRAQRPERGCRSDGIPRRPRRGQPARRAPGIQKLALLAPRGPLDIER
jgi:DNA polymerase-3 subunit delta